jgi:cytochrome c553
MITRVALLMLVLVCTAAGAEEPAAGQAPGIVGFCAVCHGDTGPSPFPDVPTIHGLPHGVIENALFSYARGMRPCRLTACSESGACPGMTMCDIAAGMNHDTRDELAEWYGEQPFPAHQDPYDPELAALGRTLHDKHCEICHTNLGSDPVDDASMLRGQRKLYLRTALEDVHQGRRVFGLAAMEELIRGLSAREMDALAEFYSGPAAYPLPED